MLTRLNVDLTFYLASISSMKMCWTNWSFYKQNGIGTYYLTFFSQQSYWQKEGNCIFSSNSIVLGVKIKRNILCMYIWQLALGHLQMYLKRSLFCKSGNTHLQLKCLQIPESFCLHFSIFLSLVCISVVARRIFLILCVLHICNIVITKWKKCAKTAESSSEAWKYYFCFILTGIFIW